MTPITKREVPEGFTIEWDDTIWNVGHPFMWSDVYSGYLKMTGVLTVKPGQTLPEAWDAFYDQPMFSEYEIFFVEGQ